MLDAVLQDEDIKSDGHLEPSRPKPQQGWKETTLYSLHKGDGQPPITKVFTQSGEGRHPKLSTTYSKQDPGRSKILSSHLERLLAGEPGTQQGTPGGEAVLPKGNLHYLSYMQPVPSEHAEPQTQVAFGSKTERPNLDRLLSKIGSNRIAGKQPLSVMDGKISAFVAYFSTIWLFTFCSTYFLFLKLFTEILLFLCRAIHPKCCKPAGEAQHQHGDFDGQRLGPAGCGHHRSSAGGA